MILLPEEMHLHSCCDNYSQSNNNYTQCTCTYIYIDILRVAILCYQLPVIDSLPIHKFSTFLGMPIKFTVCVQALASQNVHFAMSCDDFHPNQQLEKLMSVYGFDTHSSPTQQWEATKAMQG